MAETAAGLNQISVTSDRNLLRAQPGDLAQLLSDSLEAAVAIQSSVAEEAVVERAHVEAPAAEVHLEVAGAPALVVVAAFPSRVALEETLTRTRLSVAAVVAVLV